MTSNSFPNVDEYIDAKQTTLGSVFLSSDRHFIIPLNQRPWVWKDTGDVQHFLDDFGKTLTTFFDPISSPKWERRLSVSKSPHFFGTFVFYKRDEKSLEVFDGQQRLTVVFMLCAVLREIANDILDQPRQHRQPIQNIHGKFNNWLHVFSSDSSPRLKPSPFFKELFDALIFIPQNDESRQSCWERLPDNIRDNETSKMLKKSYNHIRAWANDKIQLDRTTDTLNFLHASYDILYNLFVCIEMLIEDEQYSHEVFGCLNARGQQLTPADNLKNDLFTAADKSDHEDISRLWHEIGENVQSFPKQDISEFLRRRYIALKGECKTNQVHKTIKEHEIDGHDAGAVVNRWHKDSILLRKVIGRDPNLLTANTITGLTAIFDILNMGLAQIPLLAAAKTFLPKNKHDFEMCVDIIENYVFRSSTIQQSDTPEIEEKLGAAARIIMETKNVSDFKNHMRMQVNDERFKAMFSTHIERRVKVQYYILRKLEIYLLGKGQGVIPGDHHEAKNHVEHILPKRLSVEDHRLHEWSWVRDTQDEDGKSEKHRTLSNRLGNLLILDSEINKAVGNHEFAVKQTGKYKKKSGKVSTIKCYKDSDLKWPQALSNRRNWPQWTEKQINRRQKEMAETAVKIWVI